MKHESLLKHIESLRGLAILFVVWFHITFRNESICNSLNMPHGYFGVDIFLVILGYFLIRGFVTKRNVDARAFLIGKCQRIVLPVSVLVTITILYATIFFNYIAPDIPKTGIPSILGYANHYLREKTSGYFAEDTINAPLTHLWYVGVALQIFLLAIGSYLITRRLRKSHKITICVGIGILSFLFQHIDYIKELIFSHFGFELWQGQVASYYSTFGRVWEVLAGGVVLLLPEIKTNNLIRALVITGLFAIVTPSFMRSDAADILTLVVVAGTLLLIKYSPLSAISTVYDNRLFALIGKYSFSIYLVHMPILVFYRITTLRNPGTIDALFILLGSILAGIIYYYIIEKRKPSIIPMVSIIILSLIFATSIRKTKAFRNYFKAAASLYELPQKSTCKLTSDPSLLTGFDSDILCSYDGWYSLISNRKEYQPPNTASPTLVQLGSPDNKARFVVVGDSHALHICPGLDKICHETGISGIALPSVIMPLWDRLLPYYGKGLYYNEQRGNALMTWLNAQPEVEYVLISIFWNKRFNQIIHNWNAEETKVKPLQANLASMKVFLQQLQQINKKAIIFYPSPFFHRTDITQYAQWLINKGYPLSAIHPNYIQTLDEYNKAHGELIAGLEALRNEGLLYMLDTRPFFFKDGQGRAIDHGIQMYMDENHFTMDGSILIADFIKEDFLEILSKEIHQTEN